jgi:hypothetical protein
VKKWCKGDVNYHFPFNNNHNCNKTLHYLIHKQTYKGLYLHSWAVHYKDRSIPCPWTPTWEELPSTSFQIAFTLAFTSCKQLSHSHTKPARIKCLYRAQQHCIPPTMHWEAIFWLKYISKCPHDLVWNTFYAMLVTSI